MGLATNFSVRLIMSLTGSADFGAPVSSVDYSKTVDFTSGTGAGQADLNWSDQRTLGTGATEDLDLAGVLTNAFGTSLTFVKVKGVLLYAATANTTVLTISRVATTGFGLFDADGDAMKLYAGGFFAWCAGTGNNGAAVTATTDDTLTVTNAAGASATYDVHIFGTSA